MSTIRFCFVAVEMKYLLSFSGSSRRGLGLGCRTRCITFRTSFGRVEERAFAKKDLLALPTTYLILLRTSLNAAHGISPLFLGASALTSSSSKTSNSLFKLG